MIRSVVCAVLLSAVCVPRFVISLSAAEVPQQVRESLQTQLAELQESVEILSAKPELQNPDGSALVADVAVFATAVERMLRHDEFPKDNYAEQAASAISTGRQRAAELDAGKPSWALKPGTTIRGYVSSIDGTVQPYALTLPSGVDPASANRWPLHVRLHGRADDMNEVNFIARNEGQAPPEGQSWIQLDVFGRGNNAYRWAGETDVFEAMADVQRRFRIDPDRITLHGFSMGGAGAWHLGLHFPDRWSSVGPGAGFVDFYKYQKQTELLPEWQHATLGIYDAIDYALNAFDVPVCTYGGEDDAQLVASTSTVDAAKELGVSIKLLVGPGMGHAFHPDSFREFMAFHEAHSKAGRKMNQQRREIRFTTRTLKYNRCDWLTIEEVGAVYEPSTVQAAVTDDGNVTVTTKNVAALSLNREIADTAVIDGTPLVCRSAAQGLLPDVYYRMTSNGWRVLSYDESRGFQNNSENHKRRGLQGPIDDAFMSSFVCVKGTGKPFDDQHQSWADFTLSRFRREFDKWLRGNARVIEDSELDEATIASSHLILFGDPQSNSVLKRVLPGLPVTWQEETITIGGRTFDTATHGLSLIFPNPLNPRKYVVINSGHTFHEKDFRSSNAWLFPRLGDIAVQKFTPRDDGTFDEEIVWAANFDAHWMLPAAGE
ncbi:MAG: prolyl oligopeptidase family serine peptidase [Planctomycetaceae bacterium]